MNPTLTPQQCDCVNEVIQSTPGFLEFAKKLQQCGIDCQQQINVLEQQHQMATAYKAAFFPEQP